MKLIPLTQGKFAQVDDEDYDFLMQWKWHAHKSRKTFYARRSYKGTTIPMHRVLLGLMQEDGILGDHEDRDGLNNQRYNLREATFSENARNTRVREKSTSCYLGVLRSIKKHINKAGAVVIYFGWRASISVGNKSLFLGHFPFTPEGELMAAMAYDAAARKHGGKFANLNFK